MSDYVNPRTKEIIDVVAQRATNNSVSEPIVGEDGVISFIGSTAIKDSMSQSIDNYQILDKLKYALENVKITANIEKVEETFGDGKFPDTPVLRIDSKQGGFDKSMKNLVGATQDYTRAALKLDNLLAGKQAGHSI